MAIYEIPSGKKLKIKFLELDKLLKHYNISKVETDFELKLNKAQKLYLDFYVWLSPNEINDSILCGGFNKEEEEYAFYNAIEEI